MRISLGYPTARPNASCWPATTGATWCSTLPHADADRAGLAATQAVLAMHTAEPLLNYVQDLIAATRSGRWFLQGLSAARRHCRGARGQGQAQGPAGRARLRGADDVQAILPQTIAHRLVPVGDAGRGR